ncbi:hypothetical protein DRN46_02990 [Thermococci archaeon]|nr:MAG: hypothetical protein DRN46_02990 [Thermococci archaeon]
MRVMILGAGQIGVELAKRIKGDWEVKIVELNQEKIELAKSIGIEVFKGDGTSSVVLRRAGIEEADVFVSTTGDDEVNLEACRIAKLYVPHVISIVNDESKMEEFISSGIEAIPRAKALATVIENRLQVGTYRAVNVGLGIGEIVETTVLPGSPAIGRKLKSLKRKGWTIGAIYRGEKLILPEEDLEVMEGDRILLIGDPEILKIVSEFMRGGKPQFPRQYGNRILIAAKDDLNTLREGISLASRSEAEGVDVIFQELDLEVESFLEDLCTSEIVDCVIIEGEDDYRKIAMEESLTGRYGAIVLQKEKMGVFSKIGIRKTGLQSILEEIEIPVILSGGEFPYEKVILPIFEDWAPISLEIALDVSRMLNSELLYVRINPPFFTGEEGSAEHICEEISEKTALYRIRANRIDLEGNPIQEVVSVSDENSLIVLDYLKGRGNNLFKPNVPLHIAHKAKGSVLLLPVQE